MRFIYQTKKYNNAFGKIPVWEIISVYKHFFWVELYVKEVKMKSAKLFHLQWLEEGKIHKKNDFVAAGGIKW